MNRQIPIKNFYWRTFVRVLKYYNQNLRRHKSSLLTAVKLLSHSYTVMPQNLCYFFDYTNFYESNLIKQTYFRCINTKLIKDMEINQICDNLSKKEVYYGCITGKLISQIIEKNNSSPSRIALSLKSLLKKND